MRLGNRKCAGDSGPMSLVANAFFADRFPDWRRQRSRFVGCIDGDACRQFDREHPVRLFDLDPGQAVAEKIPVLRAGAGVRAGFAMPQHVPVGRGAESASGARRDAHARPVRRRRMWSSGARSRSRQRLPDRFGAFVVAEVGRGDRVGEFHERLLDVDDQGLVDRSGLHCTQTRCN